MPGSSRYSSKVQQEYPWSKANPENEHSCICTICNKVFMSIKNGISYNLQRHVKSTFHLAAVKCQLDLNSARQKKLSSAEASSSKTHEMALNNAITYSKFAIYKRIFLKS